MASANVDQNWLRGVLAIAQNNPAGRLQTQPYAANSNKGNVKFIHDGRMYFKHRILRAGSVSAMCDQQSGGCKGRAWFQQDGAFIKIITQHGCEANPSNILSTAVRNEEKHLARTTTMATGSIINQVRNQARISGIQDSLPQVFARKRTIQRTRQDTDALRPPPIPTTLASIVIPQSYKSYEEVTGRADEWLLADSGMDEQIDGRILMFGRRSYGQWIGQVQRLLVDGTIKIAPPLFGQVFVVLAERNGFVFPVATVLLPNKRMVTYRKLFQMLHDVHPNLNPAFVSCDFELAIQNAAKGIWPNVSIDGCYWHLCSNLYKHLQEEGLSVRYDNEAQFSHECRKVVAMACVPIRNLDAAFEALSLHLPGELEPILRWFENNYLGTLKPDGYRRIARFPIDSWNLVDRVLNDQGRTNNYAEAHHRKVAGELGVSHPNLWKFIDSMKLVQRGIDGLYNEMTLGREPPKKRRKYRVADERMKRLVEQAVDNWANIVPFEYLGSIAYNFRMGQGPYLPVQAAVEEV